MGRSYLPRTLASLGVASAKVKKMPGTCKHSKHFLLNRHHVGAHQRGHGRVLVQKSFSEVLAVAARKEYCEHLVIDCDLEGYKVGEYRFIIF